MDIVSSYQEDDETKGSIDRVANSRGFHCDSFPNANIFWAASGSQNPFQTPCGTVLRNVTIMVTGATDRASPGVIALSMQIFTANKTTDSRVRWVQLSSAHRVPIRMPVGHGRLVVKVTYSWQACREFESSTSEEPPCRGAMHVKSVESSNVIPLVWCGS
ncbi:hypothetical protein TNCV_4464271 [Trichonephila clavipes]|nr:hypothetical protein TNCV_4464271 [Trichonephila clavipes]